MSEETKDIEETKVAEEKKMETEQTILSQPTEKKAAETVTQIQQSVEIQEQKEKTEPEPKRSFIRSRKKAAASREEQILSRIKDEDLMKYLEMEHERGKGKEKFYNASAFNFSGSYCDRCIFAER